MNGWNQYKAYHITADKEETIYFKAQNTANYNLIWEYAKKAMEAGYGHRNVTAWKHCTYCNTTGKVDFNKDFCPICSGGCYD